MLVKQGWVWYGSLMPYVIEPLSKKQLENFFDGVSKDVIKYFMLKALFSQPEVLPGQDKLPIQVPKEHIEQWFTQALKVKPVGSGSYPIDIFNETEKWGADLKMLKANVDSNNNVIGGDSGEASLGQNFRDAGIDLDNLFADKNYEEIKNRWVRLYKAKFESVKETYNVEHFYYFFILRAGPNFHLVGANINLDSFDHIAVNNVRTTLTSVYLEGFIENELGNTKIYKAKKRLELRLNAKEWVDQGLSIKFESNFSSIEADVRDMSGNPEFLNNELERIKKIEITIV